MPIRAVVFDLWNTLAVWPDELSRDFRRRWSSRIGRSLEEIDAAWYASGAYEQRESGPIAPPCRASTTRSVSTADVDELVGWRVELARQAVVPDDGVVETLSELRERGFRRRSHLELHRGSRARLGGVGVCPTLRRRRPFGHGRLHEARPADLRAGLRGARRRPGRMSLRRATAPTTSCAALATSA